MSTKNISAEEQRIANITTAVLNAAEREKITDDHQLVARLADADIDASVGGCGCFYEYGGFCDGENRIEVMVGNRKLVFFNDGYLEGVEG